MFRSKLPSLHSDTNWRDIVVTLEHGTEQAIVMLCGQSSAITHQHGISQHREADVTITCRIMQGHDTCAVLGNNSSNLYCSQVGTKWKSCIDIYLRRKLFLPSQVNRY